MVLTPDFAPTLSQSKFLVSRYATSLTRRLRSSQLNIAYEASGTSEMIAVNSVHTEYWLSFGNTTVPETQLIFPKTGASLNISCEGYQFFVCGSFLVWTSVQIDPESDAMVFRFAHFRDVLKAKTSGKFDVQTFGDHIFISTIIAPRCLYPR
jgi:hypothetical protein